MNLLYFAVTWSVLAVGLPYLSFTSLADAELSTEVLISLAILLYAATRLAFLAAQGRPRLLTLTFFVFIYVWIGLSATAQIAVDEYPWMRVHQPDDVLPAILEVAVAIAAYELGYLWFGRRRSTSPGLGVLKGATLVISDRAAIWMSIVAVALTLIGMVMFGFNHLFLTRAAVDAVVGASGDSKMGSLVVRALLRVPSLIAFVVLAYNGLTRWKTLNRERKRFYLLLGLLFLGLDLVANWPPGQTRFWLGAVILTPAFALPRWRRWLAPMWILGLAVGLTVVFPYLDLFRNADTLDEAIAELDTNDTIGDKLIYKPDYDVFQLTLNGYVYTEVAGQPMWGSNLLGAVAFWFPRSLWPGKPYGAGRTVGEAFHYQSTNLSAPIWMEFYCAFGWLGIVVLMMLYARACAWAEYLYECSLAPGGHEALARVVVPYWAAFQTFIMRGDLQNAVAYSSFGFLMLFATALAPRFLGRKGAVVPRLRRA